MTDSTDHPESHQRDTLRSELQLARRQLSKSQVVQHSQAIENRLLALIEPSTKLAGYLALGNEVKLEATLATARSRDCKTYAPIVQDQNQMVFAPIDDDIPLIENQYGILEPALNLSECIPAKVLDIVLVPLVGFDDQCQRMGMGGGYYDRAFAHKRENRTHKPLLVGVAYEIQNTGSVFPDWWDVPLDAVVTEKRIIWR